MALHRLSFSRYSANHFEVYLGEKVNEKVREVCQSFQTASSNSPTDQIPSPVQEEPPANIDPTPSEFFYDFQAENFHAEQVCPPTSSHLTISSLLPGRTLCLYNMQRYWSSQIRMSGTNRSENDRSS